MHKIISNFLYVGSGITVSLELLLGGIIIGFFFGTSLAILRYKGICRRIINRFVSIVRGTPLILQLSIVYFTAPSIVGFKLSVISASIITFGINSSAYVAEILRAGIESLPKGQFEAARSLEIPNYYMWKDIILPQVFINIFPAFVNEVVSLLKETSLVVTIGGLDIMRKSQIIAAEQYEYFTPLLMAGIYYYCLVLLIEFIGRKFEKWKLYAKNP